MSALDTGVGIAWLVLLVVGICMTTYQPHLTGRIVGAVLALGPTVFVFADAWTELQGWST